ncbi:hypothetical protein Tco_0537966, partial [Tanacetum coccineum]
EVILFYNGLEVPTRQILDSKSATSTKTTADAKVAIQEMAEYSQKWYNGTSKARSIETSDGLAAIQAQLNNLEREIKKVNEKVNVDQVGYELSAAQGFYQRNNTNPSYQEQRQSMEESLSKFMNESGKRHEENSNLIKEIRASTDVAIRNQGASIKTLEIQIGKMSKVLQERGFGSLPNSTETNPRDHVKSILTTVEADMSPIRRIGSSQYAVSAQQNRNLTFKSRQATILFPSRLNDYYCDDKGSYGPQYLDAYSCGATCLNDSLPRKEKDRGSHVDAYDSDCDDEATANAIFMANLSPVASINDDTVEPQLGYIDIIVSDNTSYDEPTGNNNVISYADYIVCIGNNDDNYVPPRVQKNDMILSVIKNMKSRVN